MTTDHLATIASEVPTHLPPRLRVVCFVHLCQQRMRYCPLLVEVARCLGRAPSTITHHVSALVLDGLLSHPAGSTRCAVTQTGASQASVVLGGDRIQSQPVQ